MQQRESAIVRQPHHIMDATRLIKGCQTKLGWSPSFTARVFEEYCKFLELRALIVHSRSRDRHDPRLNTSMIAPSVAIRKMWHQHLLDEQQYNQDCHSICGRVVRPDKGAFGLDPRIQWRRFFYATTMAYQARFGRIPSGEVWSFGTPCGTVKQSESNNNEKKKHKQGVVTIRVRERMANSTTTPMTTMTLLDFIFRMKAHTPMARVFEIVVAASQRRPSCSVSFQFRDQDVAGTSTVVQLGMVDGDQIMAIWR